MPFGLLTHFLTEHDEPGLRANPAKPNLLTPNVITHDLSPYLGTEIRGVQLSQLSEAGLDELALLVAERKLLIFRDQDFKDLSVDRQIKITQSVFQFQILGNWSLSYCGFAGTSAQFTGIPHPAMLRVIQSIMSVGNHFPNY